MNIINYIVPCRFDFMAKYLYIKHRDKNTKTEFFKELYHKHLFIKLFLRGHYFKTPVY